MKTNLMALFSASIFLLLELSASAQMPGPGLGQPGMNAAMLKLFGKITAFSAKVQVQMLDKTEKEIMSVPMNFVLLDGKIRLEVDMSQMKSKELTAETLAPLKQMGMEKLVTIVRPDKRATLVVYPALQSYAEMPMSSEEVADLEKKYNVEKTSLGKEPLDGHPCEKNKLYVVDGKGSKQEATVWNATDLKDFPIQMRMNQPEATVVMRYRDVQFTKAAEKQFEAPAGFAKYDSMEKLMQGAMAKMLGGK